MAKHFYTIPLQKSLTFIKEQKTLLNKATTDKKRLTYHKQLGKSYYILEIEEFLKFFKIDRDVDYALKSMEYFNRTLNFSMFKLQEKRVDAKEFFYAFCYLYRSIDKEEFSLFMQKTFLHYHSGFNANSDIKIDYKDFSIALAKTKKVEIKESFGESEKESFFKLFIDNKLIVQEKGKKIKTLRKKAYKRLFFYLLDLE